MASRGSIEKIADAISTPMALGFGIMFGMLIGAGRRRVRVGPGGGLAHPGYLTVMCSPYGTHTICVLQDKGNPDHYTFAIDNGPPRPDGDTWYAPEHAREAAERFVEAMT